LYTARPLGGILRCEVHHPRWPLQRAEAEFEENTMPASDGIATPEGAPLLHFAKRLDVVVWRPERSRE
jgi:hypothetical protein